MILGTPVVLTHTTHTHIPVRLSLHFADTGAVMRRVAYKTKQNFPLQRKKILFDKITPVLKFHVQRSTQKRTSSKIKDNIRKTRSYSGLRNKMSQGVPYICTAIRFSVQT